MWQINGNDIKDYYGMAFLNNQIHKLLVSNKANFEINSEFEESDYEQWWRVYPYGLTYSKNEAVSVDVIFRKDDFFNRNTIWENIEYFMERMTNNTQWNVYGNFQLQLENQNYGISVDIIYKGLSNITEYKNSITCTLDLYVSNLYDSNSYVTFLSNRYTNIKINDLNIGKFGCISLKGNYKELTDIYKSKMNAVAKNLHGLNYPYLKKNKKEASLRFVISADTIQSVVERFKQFIYYCKLEIDPSIPNILKLEHLRISDHFPEFEIYGVFTQFIPTYLNFQDSKALLEFTATFRAVNIFSYAFYPNPGV